MHYKGSNCRFYRSLLETGALVTRRTVSHLQAASTVNQGALQLSNSELPAREAWGAATQRAASTANPVPRQLSVHCTSAISQSCEVGALQLSEQLAL